MGKKVVAPLKHNFVNFVLPVVGVLLLISGLYYAISWYKSSKKPPQDTYAGVINSSPIRVVPTVQTAINVPMPTPYPDQLGLVRYSPDYGTAVSYHLYGAVPTGPYVGYTVYSMSVAPELPMARLGYLVATKDNQSYVLDGDSQWITSLPDSDYHSPFYFLNRSKFSEIGNLYEPVGFPEIIPLNDQYSLYRDEVQFIEDFSTYTPLNSPISTLRLYAKPSGFRDQEMQSYVKESTGVVAINNRGLAVGYVLTTPTEIGAYKEAVQNSHQKYIASLRDGESYYETILLPNLRIRGAEISGSALLYKDYDVALPGGCGGDIYTQVLKNVSEKDLVSLGWKNGREFFIFANPNHPLLKAQYASKFYFEGPNNPSYSSYVAKNPLVLFKDYWGRWVAVGEYDHLLPGGCGKPVIYLYPEKTTDVSVRFLSPIRFTVDIPTYHDGWKVRATPQGQLTDLQPHYTSCALLDSQVFGHEYAYKACKSGQYPYLYWSGSSLSGTYITPNKGWVVPRSQIGITLREKLAAMNLSETEIRDMVSYWEPTLLAHSSPYFRLSFLQTEDMNMVAPMSVIPPPETVIRVFLDWEPLSEPIPLSPQTLMTTSRKGFVLVEWGGLKR